MCEKQNVVKGSFLLLFSPKIYKGDPITCTISIPAWGSNWGSSGFSRNQNNRGSSGGYVTFMYCDLSMKINMCEMLREDCGRFCFSVCDWQKLEDLQFEPYGWQRHYTGRYLKSGIYLVYLWFSHTPTSVGCKTLTKSEYIFDCNWSLFFRIPASDLVHL